MGSASLLGLAFPGGNAVRESHAGFQGSYAVLGKGGACKDLAITPLALVAWEVSQVIFSSFLHTKLLNLFTCLILTLLNLNSPTVSTKTWPFLKLEVDKIDASFDLHSSLCLALLSRILLMDLILACRSCFSAVLIIFGLFCP